MNRVKTALAALVALAACESTRAPAPTDASFQDARWVALRIVDPTGDGGIVWELDGEPHACIEDVAFEIEEKLYGADLTRSGVTIGVHLTVPQAVVLDTVAALRELGLAEEQICSNWGRPAPMR